MNCFYHPNEAAVAQCVDCSKGLCTQCASTYKIPVCTNCNDTRRRKDIIAYGLPLCVYIVLFIVGYRWNFMATKGFPDMQIMSGYVLMSIVSGYQFVNKILPFRLLSADGGTWLIYYAFKFVLYAVAGFFTAPFTIGWNIYKFIRSIVK